MQEEHGRANKTQSVLPDGKRKKSGDSREKPKDIWGRTKQQQSEKRGRWARGQVEAPIGEERGGNSPNSTRGNKGEVSTFSKKVRAPRNTIVRKKKKDKRRSNQGGHQEMFGPERGRREKSRPRRKEKPRRDTGSRQRKKSERVEEIARTPEQT